MAKWSDDKMIIATLLRANQTSRSLSRFAGSGRQSQEWPACAAYNLVMARGWESKGVESQMDAAQEQPARPPRPLTEEEKRRQRERQGLILARTHIQQQLDASTSEQYSESLRRAMADLDEKISALDAAS